MEAHPPHPCPSPPEYQGRGETVRPVALGSIRLGASRALVPWQSLGTRCSPLAACLCIRKRRLTVTVTIHVPGVLRDRCGGAKELAVSADTVRAALEQIEC